MKQTHIVKVGNIFIGGDNPVVVQSMTDTATQDIEKTVSQVIALHKAGSELVRMTVNDDDAAKAVPIIKQKLLDQGFDVPLVGDFHYNGHTLLEDNPECAKALDKYRINPGNVGFGKKKDTQFAKIINIAIKHNKPVRIGVNWGSLDKFVLKEQVDKYKDSLTIQEIMHKALITSALESAKYAESLDLGKDKIIISCKVSEVPDLLAVYQELSKQCDYALHIGLTEAGMGIKGIVASAVSLGILLNKGVGNTIRVSLTPDPDGDRRNEVIVCREILQNLGLRRFSASVVSCPGCGRTTSIFFRHLAKEVKLFLDEKMFEWKDIYHGVEELKVAVMGCIVNGPGESKYVDIGISLPGTFEKPAAPVFVDGRNFCTLRGDNILQEFMAIISDYVDKNYLKN